MNAKGSSLLLIKKSANKSAVDLASFLRGITDSWSAKGILNAFSFKASEESINEARASFATAADAISAYADLFGRYAAEAAPLEENEPYSAERLYVACATISALAMDVIADSVTALGFDGGECSITKAAKIINDFLLKVEAFEKITD